MKSACLAVKVGHRKPCSVDVSDLDCDGIRVSEHFHTPQAQSNTYSREMRNEERAGGPFPH
jgi:hypothetical protein